MDANVYEARLKELKKAFAKVDHRIDVFGPEDVTLLDKDTYKDYLEETRKLLDEAQDAAFDLCSELDLTSVVDGGRIQEINQLESKAMRDCKNYARDMKNKMVELIASVPGIDNGTNSAPNNKVQRLQFINNWMQREDEKEARLATEKKTKIELRMKTVAKKSKDLTHKIREILDKDCQDMTDQERRENLLNSKDWERQIDDLTTRKEAIEVDSVGVDVNEGTKNTFEAEVHDAIDKVCMLIENLKLVEKEKALHTLPSSKMKDNVIYSKSSGESEKNVFKFVKDFQEATVADQVREVDKVKKQLDDLMISKEAIKQDSIGVNVNEQTKNTFEAELELHDAIDMGTNKSTAKIKLDNDAKKPTVKTVALILIAAQKFKKLLIKKKIKERKADIDYLQSLNLPPPKFTSFSVSPCEPVVKTKADLVRGFRAEGVLTKSNKQGDDAD